MSFSLLILALLILASLILALATLKRAAPLHVLRVTGARAWSPSGSAIS
jgi:hypothetical protein